MTEKANVTWLCPACVKMMKNLQGSSYQRDTEAKETNKGFLRVVQINVKKTLCKVEENQTAFV